MKKITIELNEEQKDMLDKKRKFYGDDMIFTILASYKGTKLIGELEFDELKEEKTQDMLVILCEKTQVPIDKIVQVIPSYKLLKRYYSEPEMLPHLVKLINYNK